MALPGLKLPSGFPPFLSTEHSVAFDDEYASIPMRSGHRRKRHVYTFTPKVFSVALDLSQAQAVQFHEWFEGPLRAGQELFSAQYAYFGPGLRWYTSQFVEPYTITPDVTGRWRVVAKLRVLDAGSTTGPVVSNLSVDFLLTLGSGGSLTVQPRLEVDFLVALETLSGLDVVEFMIALAAEAESGLFLLQEDGSQLLLEDGSGSLLQD